MSNDDQHDATRERFPGNEVERQAERSGEEPVDNEIERQVEHGEAERRAEDLKPIENSN